MLSAGTARKTALGPAAAVAAAAVAPAAAAGGLGRSAAVAGGLGRIAGTSPGGKKRFPRVPAAGQGSGTAGARASGVADIKIAAAAGSAAAGVPSATAWRGCLGGFQCGQQTGL